MRNKGIYPIREAFSLHALRLRAAALQADCVGVRGSLSKPRGFLPYSFH